MSRDTWADLRRVMRSLFNGGRRERQLGERCGRCSEFEHYHQDDHFGDCVRKRREGQGDLFSEYPYRVACNDWCEHYVEADLHD